MNEGMGMKDYWGKINLEIKVISPKEILLNRGIYKTGYPAYLPPIYCKTGARLCEYAPCNEESQFKGEKKCLAI